MKLQVVVHPAEEGGILAEIPAFTRLAVATDSR